MIRDGDVTRYLFCVYKERLEVVIREVSKDTYFRYLGVSSFVDDSIPCGGKEEKQRSL